MATYSEYIDKIKIEGYRPCIVGALVCKGLIAVAKSKKYYGFELVQGGINFGEKPEEALEREVIEEFGFWFHKKCNFPPKKIQYLFEDKLDTRVQELQVTESGQKIKAKGKHYLVYAVELDCDELPTIDPDDLKHEGTSVKFEKCEWLPLSKAKKLLGQISNPKKREITLKAMEMLADLDYVSPDS